MDVHGMAGLQYQTVRRVACLVNRIARRVQSPRIVHPQERFSSCMLEIWYVVFAYYLIQPVVVRAQQLQSEPAIFEHFI